MLRLRLLLTDFSVLIVSANDGARMDRAGDAGSGGTGGAGATITVVGDTGLSIATLGSDDRGSFLMLSGGGLFFFAGLSLGCSWADVPGRSISMFHTVETNVAMSFSDAVDVNR